MSNQYWYESVDSFTKVYRIMGIMKAASTVINYSLEVKSGERVHIATDTEVSPIISSCLAGAVNAAGGIPSISIMFPLPGPGSEPPDAVAAAMQKCDCLINACSRSITHSKACRHAYEELGIRYVVMSNVTEDMLLRGACQADYGIVRDISLKTLKALNQGTKIHITCPNGTDVRFDTTGRPFWPFHGKVESKQNPITVFPGGEVNTTPLEESGNGTIVFDQFLMEVGLLEEPIVWELENGLITKISGGRQAKEFEKIISEKGDEYTRYIGELAVGTNYMARSTGNAFEDKEVYGHIHIACGTGLSVPGVFQCKYQSTLHLDGIISKPTLTVDGKEVVKEGEILVAPRPKIKQ